jgi:hypothetical protein
MGHPLCCLCLRGQRPLLAAFVVPTPAQSARRNGAPSVLVMPTRSKTSARGVRGSHPSQSARRMGHPLCCLCLRGQKPLLAAFVVPTPAQRARRNGAPSVLVMPTRSKTSACGIRGSHSCAKCAQEWGTPCVAYPYEVKNFCSRHSWFPLLRKVRAGMGHPLCWLCLLGQKLGF